MHGPVTIEDAAAFVDFARIAYLDPSEVDKECRERGYSEVHFFDKKGSQAFLAINQHSDRAVLSFRGTEADRPEDLLTDIKIRKRDLAMTGRVGRVHHGFSQALDHIWPDICGRLEGLSFQIQLTIVGHSLGGALAVLAHNRMIYGRDILFYQSTIATVYTYGAPRIGNKDFVNSFVMSGRSFLSHGRVVNGADIVPTMPLLVMGYRHAGTHFYIDRKSKIHTNPRLWTVLIDQTLELVAFLKEGFQSFYPLQMFRDHRIANYIRLLKKGR